MGRGDSGEREKAGGREVGRRGLREGGGEAEEGGRTRGWKG